MCLQTKPMRMKKEFSRNLLHGLHPIDLCFPRYCGYSKRLISKTSLGTPLKIRLSTSKSNNVFFYHGPRSQPRDKCRNNLYFLPLLIQESTKNETIDYCCKYNGFSMAKKPLRPKTHFSSSFYCQ